MRVAFFVLLLASTSAGILLACSSDSTEASPAADGSAATSEASTSDVTDGGTQDTGGVEYAPSGCVLKTTDYVAGSKAESVPIPGVANTADWTNLNGALSEDGDFATVTMNDGQQSAELRVSEFGLKIPETAETWGIEVELKRRAPGGAVVDDKVDILIEGKPSKWKYIATGWPTSIVGTHHYGQAIDTWGTDLYPADVNKPTFAARLTIKRAADAGAGPITAVVDSLKVAVHYCPDPIKK